MARPTGIPTARQVADALRVSVDNLLLRYFAMGGTHDFDRATMVPPWYHGGRAGA